MLTLFDPILIAAALLVFFLGMNRLKKLRKSGRTESVSTDIIRLLTDIFTHKRIIERPVAGFFHLVLFYGFCLFLLVTLIGQTGLILPLFLSQILSFLLDMTGILMLGSTFFFIYRFVSGPGDDKNFSKLVMTILVAGIIVTGFLAAGCRISLAGSGFTFTSPVGWVFSLLPMKTPVLMQAMIRLHFFFVLLFFSLIPFTFMRHIPMGIKNIYAGRFTAKGDLRPVDFDLQPLGAVFAGDFSDKQMLEAQACAACGRCSDQCPALISQKPLNPRTIMTALFDRKPDRITLDEIWSCTTCMACTTHCPVLIDPMDKIISLRRNRVLDKGQLPKEALPMIRNLELYGDTYGKGSAHRTDFCIGEMSVKKIKSDILLWIGCSGAFHPRYQAVALAMSRLLTSADIGFGILGEKECCCGDGARRLGEESLFKNLANKNIESINAFNPEKIIAFCPHCFNTLKNEYPGLGGQFNVVSAVEFLDSLVREQKIVPKYASNRVITLHDPCYLGRANRIYDPLRNLMQAIPGLKLKETQRNRDMAFCCGGGGGRMWLHETLGENINKIRSREILNTGADIVGTACPFCMTMMEDGMGSFGEEKPPQILDLIEILALSVGYTQKGVL
jgi:Fe-S oxidoreductase